jgi:hypothetical protein
VSDLTDSASRRPEKEEVKVEVSDLSIDLVLFVYFRTGTGVVSRQASEQDPSESYGVPVWVS